MARLGRPLLRTSGGVALALGHGVLVASDGRVGVAIVASPATSVRAAPYRGAVLVVTRHRLPLPGYADTAAALAAARATLAVLADRPGFLRGWITRAVDDPDLLVLAHEWADAGSYRRALSAYDVKLHWPFLQTAADEATAFEVLVAQTPDSVVETPSALAADAATIGLGSAAAPHVSAGEWA